MASVRYQLVDTQILCFHKIVVHRFTISDMEFAMSVDGQLAEWRSSNPGKFVIENSIKSPEIHQFRNPCDFSYDFAVLAELEQSKLSEYYLRFDNKM